MWEVEIAFVEWVVGDLGEAANLQQMRRLQEVAQLLLSDVNLAIVHEPVELEKAFINDIKKKEKGKTKSFSFSHFNK